MSRGPELLLLLLFTGFFLLGSSAQQVKHAPTAEQCRADQRLWLDKLEDFTVKPDEESTVRPDYETLTAWGHEMSECKSVDPDRKLFYSNVIHEINAEEEMRLEDFLNRHHLFEKFIAEDKAGKR